MNLRKAKQSELAIIWEIIQYAIEQRRLDGSQQWQDGYPNINTVQEDLEKGYAYVMEDNGMVLLYAAIIFGKEPAYEIIEGKWLTHDDYAVLHRVAAFHNNVQHHFFHYSPLTDNSRQNFLYLSQSPL